MSPTWRNHATSDRFTSSMRRPNAARSGSRYGPSPKTANANVLAGSGGGSEGKQATATTATIMARFIEPVSENLLPHLVPIDEGLVPKSAILRCICVVIEVVLITLVPK